MNSPMLRTPGRRVPGISLAFAGILSLCVVGAPSAGAPKKPSKSPRPPSSKGTAKPPPLSARILTFPSGAAIIRAGKPLKSARKGTILKRNDVCKVGPTGSMDLSLADVARVRLKAGTTIRLATLLARDPKPGDGTVNNKIVQQRGSLLIHLSRLTGRGRFVIETPGVVTAARGTAFMVDASKDGTQVLVDEGVVTVALLKDPEKTLEVHPQEKVSVAATLPEKALPQEDAEKRRLREVRDLARAIDRETIPQIAAIDRLLTGKRYDPAEALARAVMQRAWGRPSGVLAQARLIEGVRRRTGTSTWWHDPDLDITGSVKAWAAAALPAVIGDPFPPAVQAFQNDTVARRWILVKSAAYKCYSGDVAGSIQRVMAFRDAPGADDIVRSECLALAGITVYDRATEEGVTLQMMQEAYDRMAEVALDPSADRRSRLQSMEKMMYWPTPKAPSRKNPRVNLELFASVASEGRDPWSHYFATGAYEKLNRPRERARSAERFFAAPRVRGPGGQFPQEYYVVARGIGEGLHVDGDEAGARKWYRFFLDEFPNAPEAERTRAKGLLDGLGNGR